MGLPCRYVGRGRREQQSDLGSGHPSPLSVHFRVIPCEKYLEHFSSDRSHMKTEDGAWLSPAPSWEPILKDGLNNLDDFISMDSKILTDISAVFDENEMRRRYGGEQLISQS